MAVADDVRVTIDSLKKITDTIDKIEAVRRDLQLMLVVTRFSYVNLRTTLIGVEDGLIASTALLTAKMFEVVKQISLAQGGP